MRRIGAVLACLVIACAGLDARQTNIGRWKSYTDMRSVRAIARSGDSLWAGSSGGVFLFGSSESQFSSFTNSEGLSSNDLTAATLDRDRRLWVGTSEGFINMYDASERVWRIVRGIAESNRIQKGIRAFHAHNDSLFVGTDFGVVVYLMRRTEFGDTYGNFGFTQQPKVNSVLVHRGTIWVATDSGVVSATLRLTNLSSPTAWTRYALGPSAAANSVKALSVFRDTLFAGTGMGLSVYRNGAFVSHGGFTGKTVSAMEPSGGLASDRLFILWNSSSGASIESIGSAFASPLLHANLTSTQASSLAARPAATDLWIGTSTQGIAQWNGTQWKFYAPNGPRSNLFVSLVVDERGVLWAGSGISGRGSGFYRFDPSRPVGSQWKNFYSQAYPLMAFDDYYKVSLGREGTVWASSWGRGVVHVVQDSIRRRISTPTLAGAVPHDPSYVVVGGIATDANERTWIVNRTAINGFYLVRLTGDSTFDYYSNGIVPAEGRFTSIAIDRYGTKWIANSEPQDKPASGLTYFNENPGVVAGTQSTNGWGLITTPILPDNNVLALAIDLDGDVCVGTDAGLLIITDPRNPTRSQPPSYYKPLSVAGQVVQAIAVDAVNNKWVGTREGISVLSPDGVQLLQFYNVASTNGKLLSNDIRALAIDQRRGIVYVGTEKGLSSLEISPVQTVRSFTTLEFAPNPFLVPSDAPLIIHNLVTNSSIRILTVSGSLVREFPAQGGGRAFWDGRNTAGDLVPSGVYFVVASTENGNQLTTGKIAVVRR